MNKLVLTLAAGLIASPALAVTLIPPSSPPRPYDPADSHGHWNIGEVYQVPHWWQSQNPDGKGAPGRPPDSFIFWCSESEGSYTRDASCGRPAATREPPAVPPVVSPTPIPLPASLSLLLAALAGLAVLGRPRS